MLLLIAIIGESRTTPFLACPLVLLLVVMGSYAYCLFLISRLFFFVLSLPFYNPFFVYLPELGLYRLLRLQFLECKGRRSAVTPVLPF